MNTYYLRLYSILALVGVVVTCIGEFCYFNGFAGTNQQVSIDLISKTDASHISAGMYCGIIGTGLWLFITYPLRVALFRTSFALRQWIQAALLLYIGSSLVFHVVLGFLGMNEQIALTLDVREAALASSVRQQARSLFEIVLQVSIATAILFSTMYVYAVFKGSTQLPRWSVILTPICVFVLLKQVPSHFLEIPSPYGGWIEIASVCAGLFAFFLVIVISAWRNALAS